MGAATPARKPMNLPNRLTLTRIILIPFFVGLMLTENVTADLRLIAPARWLAFIVFIAAAITDYYDGAIARRMNLTTNFGKLFDPLADKLLTMSAFVVFVEIHLPQGRPIFPAWAIILILGREFLVTGLRTLAVSGGRVIQADRWGKHKTAWQLSAIIAITFFLCVRDTLMLAGVETRLLDLVLPWICGGLLAVVVFLTVVSGAIYLHQNRDLLRESV